MFISWDEGKRVLSGFKYRSR